jgi:hypothetical protein
MNERIKQIASQANIVLESHPHHQSVDTAIVLLSDLEKFAMVIASECIVALAPELITNSDVDGIDKMVSKINTHFGFQ